MRGGDVLVLRAKGLRWSHAGQAEGQSKVKLPYGPWCLQYILGVSTVIAHIRIRSPVILFAFSIPAKSLTLQVVEG